jgi:nicotinamide mononucleotide adenylyltransferase
MSSNTDAILQQRMGTDIDEALSTLQAWRENIFVIQQLVQNDISSTKIRLFLRRDMSIRYLVPEQVVDYIEEHDLYGDDGPGSTATEKGKEKRIEQGANATTEAGSSKTA